MHARHARQASRLARHEQHAMPGAPIAAEDQPQRLPFHPAASPRVLAALVPFCVSCSSATGGGRVMRCAPPQSKGQDDQKRSTYHPLPTLPDRLLFNTTPPASALALHSPTPRPLGPGQDVGGAHTFDRIRIPARMLPRQATTLRRLCRLLLLLLLLLLAARTSVTRKRAGMPQGLMRPQSFFLPVVPAPATLSKLVPVGKYFFAGAGTTGKPHASRCTPGARQACLGRHAAQSDARTHREACMLRVPLTHMTEVGHRPRARQKQAAAGGHFYAKSACQKP